MTRIFGSMVVKNEAERYLRAVLSHMKPFFDELFIYDDQSEDDSLVVALRHGTIVSSKPDNVPSFLEHESDFRFAAWKCLENNDINPPVPGDWILSFDADEFLVGVEDDFSDVRTFLIEAIEEAEKTGCVGVRLPFPEVFATPNQIPHYRVDGLWNTIKGPRLFKYMPGAEWSGKAMGSGSEPTYIARGKILENHHNLWMLHFGYADASEHAVKHQRYTELYDHGHNNSHIQSIITKPTLKAWVGPIPEFNFGKLVPQPGD